MIIMDYGINGNEMDGGLKQNVLILETDKLLMKREEKYLSLNAKIRIAKTVIEDALENFNRSATVWSAGKDSTVVLSLVKDVFIKKNLNIPPAILIDHGQHYDETYEMVNKISKEWNFKVLYAKNDNFIRNVNEGKVLIDDLNEDNINELDKINFDKNKKYMEYSLETFEGNHLLKTVPFNNIIKKYRFDALYTGVRWDENEARSIETFISRRDNPEHYRVQPIILFTEKNIWEYMFAKKLPIHPLYYQGYRSIDGKYDSKKISDNPAWEQDLENTEERAGRAQDKEKMMERLREFGYM